MLYPVGLVVAIFTQPDLNIGWFNFAMLLVGSSLFPIVNILAFRANKHIDSGLYSILNNLTPIVTIAAASLLLSEGLNGQQLVGAVIIIGSAVLVTLPRLSRRSVSRPAGLMFAVASVTILGLAIVFERWMLTRMDFGSYLVFGWGAQALWMTVLTWSSWKHFPGILKAKKQRYQIIGYGFAHTFKGLAFVSALSISGNASVVSAFVSFMAVLVVLAAYFVLKEKEWLWLKITLAVVGAVGLIILNTA